MSTNLSLRFGFSEIDLSVPTSTSKYPVGTIIRLNDSTGVENGYIYIKSHDALTAYVPYIVTHNGTDLVTKAPVTGAATVVIPQVAFTANYYGFAQFKGNATAAIGAETYTAGDSLEVLTTGVVVVVDGTTGDKVRTVNTVAQCKADGTTAANISVYMYGNDINDIAAT
jgi:hypothetical protein